MTDGYKRWYLMREALYLGCHCTEEGKNFLKRYDQAGKAKWLILVIAAGILLLGVILYAGGRWLETRSVEEARGDLTQTEAVETQEYNGVTYQRREGLTSILVMGVDHDSAVESEGAYQGGQGDFQRLIVIDPERQVIRQLKIDRDTMTECTVLGYLGSPIGTKEMQISLRMASAMARRKAASMPVRQWKVFCWENPLIFTWP